MRIFGVLLKKNIKQTIIYVAILVVISVILTQIGIGKIDSIYQEEKDFENLENRMVDRWINYHQYGGYGIRLKISPEPIAALFVKSTPFLNINAFIDIGARLYIYNEISPDKVLDQRGYLDFMWFMMVVGCLMVSTWGWNLHNDEERTKFLTSVSSGIFKWKLLAGMTLIFLTIILISVQVMMQFLINGYSIDMGYLGIFLGVVCIAYIVFFLLSALLGFGNKKKRKILFASIWILFVLLLPESVKIISDNRSKVVLTCKYIHEQKKVEILMRFEREAFAKASRLKTKEEKFKVSVESAGKYLKIESKELEKLQRNLLESLEKEIGRHNLICQLTPMTWLKSTAMEISTQGFNGYQRFHLYSLQIQMKFMKFIMDKLYFDAPNYGPVHSFQKEGENIFRFKSTLPGYFLLGVLWHIMLVFLLIWMNYVKFKKSMFKDEREKINDPEIKIEEGRENILLTRNEALKQHIFCHFAGGAEFKGELTINSKEEQRRKFIYLYKKDVMDAHFTPKEMKKLLNEKGEGTENWKIITEHAKRTGKILIMVDFIEGLKKSEIIKILDYLKKEKLLFLLITDRDIIFRIVPGNIIMYMQRDNTIELIEEI